MNKELSRLRGLSLKWLSRREYSRFELAAKLQERATVESVVTQILDELVAQGWQSDARYARMYVAKRLNQGYGPLRIQQALIAKHIEPDLIQAAFQDEDATNEHWLERCWRKKFHGQLPCGPASWQKQIRFLLYRGFSSEVAQRWLRYVQTGRGIEYDMV